MTAPPTNGTTPPNGTKPPSRLANVLRRLRGTGRTSPKPPTGAPTKLVYPASPFTEWDFDRANKAIDDALDAQTIDPAPRDTGKITPAQGDARFLPPRRVQDPIAVNHAFYGGDHWQNGSGYIGPHPQSFEAGFNDVMIEIANIFTSQNVVREVTDRHALGVVGKPFQWQFTPRRPMKPSEKPNAEEQTAIDEATRLMQDWMLARNVPSIVRKSVATLLLSERSALQLCVPPGLADAAADGHYTVSAASVEEGLTKVWLEHPGVRESTVATDRDTRLEVAVHKYEAEVENDDDTNDPGDTHDDTKEYVSLSYLDRDGSTIVRVIDEDNTPDAKAGDTTGSSEVAGQQSHLQLGGRIPMFEMHRPALITPQIQQQQRAMNFALTMVPRNITSGGFLERLILDAQQPGHWERDKDGNKTGKWIPAPFHVGAGTTNFFSGVEWTDEAGIVHHEKPSVQFREPVKPDASLAAADAHRASMLAEVGQSHILISASSTPSARSRVESRLEYLGTLKLTQPEVESAVRFILETALAMAEAIANMPGYYTEKLRAQVSVKLDTGLISPEERQAIETSIGKTISRETAMVLLNVDDIDAELASMSADPLARAALAKVIGEALLPLTQAGATLEGAAKFTGVPQAELDKLLFVDESTLRGPGPALSTVPVGGAPTPGAPAATPPKPGEPTAKGAPASTGASAKQGSTPAAAA